MSNITIREATGVTKHIHAAVCKLVLQLSPTAQLPSHDDLVEMINSPTKLLLAYDGERIAGMLTIVFMRLPTGLIAHIDDTVVDDSMRRRGIGRRLVAYSLQLARESGVREVHLTSQPTRVAANELYRSLGFQRGDTNAYNWVPGK